MSGGYQRGSGDGLDGLVQQINEIKRRLRELEIPSGTQNASLVAQVQAKLAELTETVEELVESAMDDFYTKAEIDAKVASPGAIAPSTVTASGAISSAGSLTVAGEVRMPNVPVTILTSAYFATYGSTSDGGRIGHVPSSQRFKQDIAPATLDPATLQALQVVTFRYINAVEELGEDADQEIGLIAEEVHALGLHWLVYYDADGLPFGIKYDRLSLALLPVVQSLTNDVAAIKTLLGV
ncbi:tail fiber domain-containing protein [Agromyces aureus]|uniref:Peptidase S74 domain-containing protein n=1 Tax=Agromyces aureus TaxID=453304 RepID=A0A191WEJ6_9MICO|nr:tail fiber domain-containing protein [Agromyces aureus]ANJ26647.1 hypothetical protein ATC03_07915 [Agromyces aureus]